MNVTIRNRKPSVELRSLKEGDFFVFAGDLHMKISAADSQASPGCTQVLARYFGNDDVNGLTVSIPDWALVEPARLVEIVVELIN